MSDERESQERSRFDARAVSPKRAERLNIARRVYQVLVAQDPDRLITLSDSSCKVVARDDLRPEQDDPEIAS